MVLLSTVFEVENLKCGGCAHTISKALFEFEGLSEPSVDLEGSQIGFSHPEDFNLEAVKVKLADLGYPEVGTAVGLNKMIGVAKSYMSCAIGKMTS